MKFITESNFLQGCYKSVLSTFTFFKDVIKKNDPSVNGIDFLASLGILGLAIYWIVSFF